jgi:hypothetical protein
VTDPFNLTIEMSYTSAGSGAIVMPAVGNLNDDNGDGRVDETDIPDIVFTTWIGQHPRGAQRRRWLGDL